LAAIVLLLNYRGVLPRDQVLWYAGRYVWQYEDRVRRRSCEPSPRRPPPM